MPRRIFIRDGGLTSSRSIPNGYVAIGTDSGIPKKQILSIISEFTGSVTGNGTTNYVPRWNSVTGLSSTSSIYIDGDGNIGIGYTSQANTSLLIRGKGDFFGNKAIKVSSTGLGDIFTVEDYVPRVTIGASYTTIPATITLGNNTATQNFIGFGNNSELGWLGSQTNNGLRMQFTDRVNNQTDIFLSSDPATLTYGNSYVSAAFRYNVLIGTPAGFNPGNPYPSNSPVRLWVKGMGTSSATYSLKVDDGADNPLLHVRDDGYLISGNGNFLSYEDSNKVFLGSNKYKVLSFGPYNTELIKMFINTSETQILGPVILGGSSRGNVGNSARVAISGDGSLGVRNIGFRYNGTNGATDYAIGNESDGLNTTIRLSFTPTQFGYVGVGLDANNSWRIGIGTSSISSHRVVISDGLKLESTTFSSSAFDIQNSGSSLFIVSNTGNVGIGTTSPTSKLHIKGSGTSSGTYSLKIDDGVGNPLLSVRNDGYISAGDNTQLYNTFLDYYNGTLKVNYNTASSFYWNGSELYLNGLNGGTTGGSYLRFTAIPARNYYLLTANASGRLGFSSTGGYADMQLSSNGNLFIGTDVSGFDATARLHIKGIDNTSSNYGLKIESASASSILSVRNDGRVFIGKSIIANAPMEVGFGQDPYSTGLNTALGVSSLISWIGPYSSGANIAVGYETLKNLTTGQYNVAVGYKALTNVVTGGYNTALNYSLISNLTGEYNVALGYGNLNVSTSSNTNIAIGRENLFSFTSGTNNIAISGYAGLYNLVTGSNNIAIGYLSLAYVTSASSNTVIGNSSLNNNPFTGDNNTVIGDSNLSSVTTGSNNTVIGRNIQSWTSSLSNNILIGDGSGNIRIMSDSTGNIGIGLTGPSYPLHVSGTVSSDGYNIGATAGFTGTGTYTNFTIIGGIIVSAS